MKTIKYLTLLIVLISWTGFSQDSKISLADNGIPATFSAPSGSKISAGVGNGMEMEGVKMHVWEVSSGQFILEVSMEDDDLWQEQSEYMNDEKESVEEDEEFDSIVSETANGFIYKLNTEDGVDYGFYVLKIKDNRAIEFRTGLSMSPFTLEQVKNMYEAAEGAE